MSKHESFREPSTEITSRRVWITAYLKLHKCRARFTNRGLSEEIMLMEGKNPHHTFYSSVQGPDGTAIIEDRPIIAMMHEVGQALVHILDEEGHRIFINSVKGENGGGPTWFHRDIATHDEVITFSRFLRSQGKALEDEADFFVRFARGR